MRMKSFYITCLCLLVAFLAEARILTVEPYDNPNTYRDFGIAMLVAVNGDTIEVLPGTPSMGSYNFEKSVTVIGHGFFLGQNYSGMFPPNYSGWGFTSSIQVRNGESVTLMSVNIEGDINTSTNSKLSLVRSKCRRIWVYDYTEVNIQASHVQYLDFRKGSCSSQCRSVGAKAWAVNSFVFGVIADNNLYEATFINCIINQFDPAAYYGSLINSIVVKSGSGYSSVCSSPMRTVRFSVVDQGGCGSTNSLAADPSQVFSNRSNFLLSDSSFYLIPNSPANGAGYNGVDCGIFGGPTPYVLSGLPSRPWIYEFMAPPAVSQQNPAAIEIKVKAID